MKASVLRFSVVLLFFSFSVSNIFAQNISLEKVQQMLISNGFSAANSHAEYLVSDAYSDAATNISHIYLQQTYQGIKVLNTIQTLAIKNNLLASQSGKFITKIESKTNNNLPTISALEALKATIQHLGLVMPKEPELVGNQSNANQTVVFPPLGIAKDNIKVQLVWVYQEKEDVVKLAWNVSIDVINSDDFWNVRVDAANGVVINKDNYTVYEQITATNPVEKAIMTNNVCYDNSAIQQKKSPLSFSANYQVIPFPYENRYAGAIANDIDPWNKAGINNNATTLGWQTDGVVVYNYSRGNNVYAYDDSLANNLPGKTAISSTSLPSLNFISNPDFTKQPWDSLNRSFAITNMFYWNNIMHDLSYQYGFTEAAGNFQYSNIDVTRGGIAGDYVNAQAQDGAGTNNANFSTPPDGTKGRMRMYLYKPLTNFLTINAPSSIAGIDSFKEGAVSPYNLIRKYGSINGNIVYYNDDTLGTIHTACSIAKNNLIGKIAFFNSTSCSYVTKIKNAQNAGAIAVIVGRSSGPASVMGGTDSSIIIPAVMISSTDAAKIITELNNKNNVNVTINNGIWFDGAIDNTIVTHEYTHGISNRLTGGPSNTSCLSQKESGGEGWSDYVGMMVTTNWANTTLSDDTKPRAHGAYASSQIPNGLGSRTKPYCTDMTVNPHTYSDLANPLYKGEVHYIGEVWCSALWDITWNIIKQDGTINPNLYDVAAGGGNVIALQLVIEGMKLQPCKPGFLDARNAILSADTLLYNGIHSCAIWKGFAGRGMGYSAIQGLSDSTNDQVAAFDMPPACNTFPVKLLEITANKESSNVFLQWNTTNEMNVQSYIIEHHTLTNEWNTIGSIVAKNNIISNNYSFVHKNVNSETQYYRLKMMDKDGHFAYSKTVVVNENSNVAFSVFPNPINEEIHIQLQNNKAESITIELIDMQGKVLILQSSNLSVGNNFITVNTSTLKKGSYILKVNGTNHYKKLLVK